MNQQATPTETAPHPGVSERAGYLGGSDAAAVLSLSPYSSPFQVFCQKRGIEVPRSSDAAQEERFEFGHLMEPVIATAFSKRFGIPTRRTLEPFYRSTSFPFMGGHLDFEVDDDSRVFVECKNIENEYRGEWGAPADSITEDSSTSVPLYYLTQCDHYMQVRNAPHCFLVALFGGCKLRTYRIERSAERLAILCEAEGLFWNRVQRDDPPPFTGIDDLTLALRSGYLERYNAARAKKEKHVLQLDEVGAKLASAAYSARRRAKRAKEEADLAKDALLVQLEGQTGYLQVGDEKYGSFLTQERDFFDEEGLKIAYPEVHAAFSRKRVYGPVLRLTKSREEAEQDSPDPLQEE